jgi:hypothetical protein
MKSRAWRRCQGDRPPETGWARAADFRRRRLRGRGRRARCDRQTVRPATLRNVKAENVERRVELGNWVAAKREQKSRARWRRRAQDFLPFHPHIDSYGPQYNVESKGRFVRNVLCPKTTGSFAPEPREGNGCHGRRTRQHCRSASEAKPIADDGAVIAARHNSCLRSPVACRTPVWTAQHSMLRRRRLCCQKHPRHGAPGPRKRIAALILEHQPRVELSRSTRRRPTTAICALETFE